MSCVQSCVLYSLYSDPVFMSLEYSLLMSPVSPYLFNCLENCVSLFRGIQLLLELLNTLPSFHVQDIPLSRFSSCIFSTSCWAPLHFKYCFSSVSVNILEHAAWLSSLIPMLLLPSMYWLRLFLSNLEFSPELQRRANICNWRSPHEYTTDSMFKMKFTTFPSRFMDGIGTNINGRNHPLSHSSLFNFSYPQRLIDF